MAKEDYNVADRVTEDADGNNLLLPGNKVQETVASTPDADAAEFARDADVSHPAYANYVTALDAFTDRPDIEPLRERRLREYGSTFGDAEFMRERPYNADGTASTPPRPGTVYGDAPKAGGADDAGTELHAETPADGD
jgi:hypothetical protein